MTSSSGIAVSDELHRKCDAVSPLAQELNDVLAVDHSIEDGLTAIGVMIGAMAVDIATLQYFFLVMEHAAVAMHAIKHGTPVREN